MINEEEKVEEISSEEIVEQLKKDLELKKVELKKAQKVEGKASKNSSRISDIQGKIPWPGKVAACSCVASVASFLFGFPIIGSIRYNVKEYFASHPDAFEYAKKVTGSSDIDYISGFVKGSDSAAQALADACGVTDFHSACMNSAFVDAALVGCAVFAVPVVASVLSNLVCDVMYKRSDGKFSKARGQRIQVEDEFKGLERVLNKLETQENGKKFKDSKPVKTVEQTL